MSGASRHLPHVALAQPPLKISHPRHVHARNAEQGTRDTHRPQAKRPRWFLGEVGGEGERDDLDIALEIFPGKKSH